MKLTYLLTPLTLLAFVMFVNALEQCPSNCMEKTCSKMGCVRCLEGFYLYLDPDSGKSICARSCPGGYYVNPVSWCEKCETINCVKCSDEYTCTECEDGYHVNKDGDCIFTLW